VVKEKKLKHLSFDEFSPKTFFRKEILFQPKTDILI
jgi:hypothetical protein